eukprot:308859-Hanusia_phi.AAC.1
MFSSLDLDLRLMDSDPWLHFPGVSLLTTSSGASRPCRGEGVECKGQEGEKAVATGLRWSREKKNQRGWGGCNLSKVSAGKAVVNCNLQVEEECSR